MAARKAKDEAPDSLVRLKIGGRLYEVDLAKLTLGEKADIAGHLSCAIEDMVSDQMLLAATYLAMKRKRPATSWADVENLTDDQFEDVDEDPPTSTPATSGTPAS